MDFDDEMSGLQIEDLGDYLMAPDIGDSWKGFSLGYGEEENAALAAAAAAAAAGAAPSAAAPASLAPRLPQATGFGFGAASGSSAPIAIPNQKLAEQQQQLLQHFASPPMASFSDMLKTGNGFSLNSPRQDFSFSPSLFASAANMLRSGDADSKANDDPMDLSSFSLDALKKIPHLPPPHLLAQQTLQSLQAAAPKQQQSAAAAPSTSNVAMKPAAACQNIIDASGKKPASKEPESAAKRPFEDVEPCSADSCSTIAQPEDDRGYRKKSREKMRRQEVNVKFDELIDLLGLSNRVRKSAILQEAVAAIKALKRDRDDMRRERDRLQHEVSKLATCLQYSHLGSVAAASAISLNQGPGALQQQLNSTQLSQLSAASLANMPQALQSGALTFGSAFANLPATASAGSSTPTPPSTSTKIAIAPKKPAAAASPFATMK